MLRFIIAKNVQFNIMDRLATTLSWLVYPIKHLDGFIHSSILGGKVKDWPETFKVYLL